MGNEKTNEMENGNPTEKYLIPGIHRKLKNYKFNNVKDCYEFILQYRAPKETTVISKPLSKGSLEALKCVVILYSWEKKNGKENGPEISATFAKLLARLTYGVQGDKKYEARVRKLLSTIFLQMSPEELFKLISLLFDVDKNLVCLSILYNWACLNEGKTSISKEDIFSEAKGGKSAVSVADLFQKEFLMTKVPKSCWVLEKVSENLLPCLRNNTACVESILNTISKALLRSPETVVEAVGYTLKALKPTLPSETASELAKRIGSCLNTENEKQKHQAVFASRSLFASIPDEKILQVALNEYIELVIPSSKAAKSALTSGPKITVLNVIRIVGDDIKTPGAQLSLHVVEKCLRLLETDVHEGTLLESMEVLSAWIKGLSDECPTALLKYIKNGLNTLKGLIRLGLCRLLVELANGGRVKWLTDITDQVSKCVEKAVQLPAVVNNLSEAIALDLVLLKAADSNNTKATSVKVPDSVFSQAAKVVGFADDKFLSGCTTLPWVFVHLVQLVQELSKASSSQSITISSRSYAIPVYCFPFADYSTRVQLKSEMKKILSPCPGNHRLQMARHFIAAADEVVNRENISDHIKYGIVISLAESLKQLIAGSDASIKADLAVEFLVATHQFHFEDLWLDCIEKRWGLKAQDILETKKDFIYSRYVKDFDCSTLNKRILKTLTKIHSNLIMSECVDTAVTLMNDPDFLKISRDDYFVFLTPEGQLYNSSIIENGFGDAGRNMKRESKAYSYREQQEEIQLRKELEEKKKKSGKGPTYTPKQLEAMKSQLAKEAVIRNQVAELDVKIQNAVGILTVLMEADSENFGLYIKDFINQLVAVMKSPVAAPPAVNFFVDIGKSILYPRAWFGEVVAQCCLRLIKPLCDPNKEWQNVKLEIAVESTLNQLKEFGHSSTASSALLSFAYPFLRLSIQEYSQKPSILIPSLQIVANFCSSALGDICFVADSIPRSLLTKMLYGVIENNDGKTQQLAVSTLVSLLKTSNAAMEFMFLESQELRYHLEALRSHVDLVRDTSLTCLDHLCQTGWMTDDDELKNLLSASVYREQFDVIERISELGKKVWESTGLPQDFELYTILAQDVLHPCEAVRTSAAKAYGDLLQQHKDQLPKVLEDLRNSYTEYEILIPPVVDSFGRVLEESVDKWEGRCGVGLAIQELAPLMTVKQAEENMTWIVTETLGDRSNAVHVIMLEAAVKIVEIHGNKCLNSFIDIIETFLEKAEKSRHFDNVRQACVVLMGSLAKHLDPKDKRVKSIFDTLLETLSTPSEKVQEAVANCLPGLVPAIKGDAEAIVAKLAKQMMGSDNFGERRGAAYGLAGVIKGLGILSLKQHDIMNMLATGMQDKKDFKKREGSLMALELLCLFLGRLFEPYIVHVLPYLLQCLGDSNVYVREATENTAKRVMSRLSGHGVKLVLPALLAALNEDSWRTKCGSVELLGRMAYCAPRQLSGCLPMIVPKLIEVLGDSHVKVQDAATKALSLIGSVIQNPEVASVVPVLLAALQDPGKKASGCLQALLQTEFVHVVDSPSLALIMPVVERAFQDRSTENRKLACQIIGNMYSLTDHSDLEPYMENVMPGIKTSLLDPVPEVRAVAAKALGAMAKGMGEKCYEELLPWLMKTLVSDVNSVDRSGAAQGLAEVIGALGEENLHKFMPEIIRKADSDDLAPHVRDGYMMMFIYMPGVFETAFVQYIGLIINPILKALADENEYVRDTALKAGQRIVTGFADSAITLLLPELEKGVFDDNWRIRYSSIQLLGDLLYKISGVSGKMSTESANDDDNFGTEQSQKLIAGALGVERRNRVLAGLYMGRSDVALMVRQASLHIWKVVVANTPRTLREILPTLFSLLLGCLAASSHDRRTVAARTLGDLVRKLGEKILPEIIPILERGLDSKRPDERQGVCIGLCEIMANTSREMILAFVDNLLPTLKKALCDPEPEVREAAALTFGSLHSNVGSRAIEDIVPFLMKQLSQGSQEAANQALDGLGQILIVKSKVIMPYLIPQLTAKPPNTRAMAVLASTANDAMSKHMGKILPCLLEVLIDNADSPQEAQELENCNSIILTVTEDTSVRSLIDDLLENAKSDNVKMKKAAVTLLSVFCINTKADLTDYVAVLLRGLISLMTETNEDILHMIADAVTSIVKNLDSNEKLGYVAELRQAVMFVRSDLKTPQLPGVCLMKKGINPLLPIYREGILNGSSDMKEQSTLGMCELIELSTEEALKPSVINITGPLIRILGDRYGPTLKCAVLDCLSLLLAKVPRHLKAFLPQLQTTFLKSSVDQNRNVRLKAAVALSLLLPIHLKPDPMFVDLMNSLKGTDDVLLRDTLLYTLRCTTKTLAGRMSEPTKKSLLTCLWNYLSSNDETTKCVSAGALGILLCSLTGPDFESTMSSMLTDEVDNIRITKTSVLAAALSFKPDVIYSEKYQEKINKVIIFCMGSEKPALVANAIRCSAFIFIHSMSEGLPVPSQLIQPFAKAINNSSNEVKTLLGQASEVIARSLCSSATDENPKIISKEVGRYLIPALVNGTKEKNSIVRASCESALITILHLREGDAIMNNCMNFLDSGAREALNDVINKTLRKTMKEPESKSPDIDDTILT